MCVITPKPSNNRRPIHSAQRHSATIGKSGMLQRGASGADSAEVARGLCLNPFLFSPLAHFSGREVLKFPAAFESEPPSDTAWVRECLEENTERMRVADHMVIECSLREYTAQAPWAHRILA